VWAGAHSVFVQRCVQQKSVHSLSINSQVSVQSLCSDHFIPQNATKLKWKMWSVPALVPLVNCMKSNLLGTFLPVKPFCYRPLVQRTTPVSPFLLARVAQHIKWIMEDMVRILLWVYRQLSLLLLLTSKAVKTRFTSLVAFHWMLRPKAAPCGTELISLLLAAKIITDIKIVAVEPNNINHIYMLCMQSNDLKIWDKLWGYFISILCAFKWKVVFRSYQGSF